MDDTIIQRVLTKYPRSMTILPTYRCNAACSECCFESNPSMTTRLTLSSIKSVIDQAADSFPALELIVFSGGECFLLGNDLIEAVRHVTNRGLYSRCVSNGFWGRSEPTRRRTVRNLLSAGLSEINFSTGLDHQKWVSADSVIKAAKCCVDHGIMTLVTVEKDTEESRCFEAIKENPIIADMMANSDQLFRLVRNVWMPFQSSAADRGWSFDPIIDKPCDQVFTNIVLTPYEEVSACCGLTFEYIPEMKLGTIGKADLYQMFQSEVEDFLKIWIHLDGPYKIMRKLFGPDIDHDLSGVSHICQACVIMHKNEKVRNAIRQRWAEFAPDVLHRFFVSMALHSRLEEKPKPSNFKLFQPA